MSDSLVSPLIDGKSTRLDSAHDLMSATESEEQMPWMALAGRDVSANTAQLERQTGELLAYVQKQNEEIDVRQAELNAKLAQLDHELRTARLQSADGGTDLLAHAPTPEPETQGELPPILPDDHPDAEVPTVPDEPTQPTPPSQKGETFQEFDEVERVVARFAETVEEHPVAESSSQTNPPSSVEADAVPHCNPDTAPIVDSHRSVDSFPHLLTSSHLSRIEAGGDIHAMATSLDASEVESERRLLAERKIELDRRKAVLQRMQDETQSLHKEALEMRLVTEQLWVQLSEKAPQERINELLGSLRTRLDQDYRRQHETLEERKNELASLKRTIEEKQHDLRDQSHKLQEWVESRHDEIKSYAAQIDARELLLDRREHRMQEEFSKWEAQRASYQRQLKGVLKKLNLSGICE